MKPHYILFGGIIMVLACSYGAASLFPIMALSAAIAGGK